MRRTTSILLYNSNKEVLLQKRDNKDWIWNPNAWGFFGGGVEENETDIDCVIRETKEELNYDLKNPLILNKLEYPDRIVTTFVEKIDESNLDSLVLGEGQDWGWFRLADTKKLNFGKGVKYNLYMLELLEEYLDK